MVGTGTAAPILSSNALPIGTRVHEFEITRVVGEGGFSVVYLAFDHTLHRSIALKEYIPSALASRRGDNTVAVRSAQHQQTFEAGLRSFINEARLLAQFDHPALVKVYRFWESNGTAYMAMPYYEGRTLKQILREHPEQATEAWLKRLLVPLLDALELLHRHRCYHRDIAPDNIQVLENEAPVLLDFGAARRTIGDMTQAFTVILKPGYAPIEQYADEADLKQGPWTDVYALAAVLYGAVVHKPPPTAVARVIKDPLEPLAKRALPGYSATFLSGIDRGLGVRPEERPQSIGEWRAMLGMPGEPAAAASRAPPPRAAAQDAKASVPVLTAQTPPQPAPAPQTQAVTETVDVSAEKDRTVLVPGLRRTLRRAPPAVHGDTTASADDSARAASWLRRPAIAALGAGVVVVLALLITLGTLRHPRPASQSPAPPAVAAAAQSPPPTPLPIDRVPMPATISPSGEPKPSVQPKSPAASETPASVSGEAKPAGPIDVKPAPASEATSTPASEVKTQPASEAKTQAASEAKTAPQTDAKTPSAAEASAPSPGDAKGASQSAKSSPTSVDKARPVKPSPEPKAPPRERTAPATTVSAADERWARIKDSGNLADLLQYQREFPRSAHTREAARRIAEINRRAQDDARAQAPNSAVSAKGGAQADEASAGKRVESAALAAPAASGAKAVVRVRVQPFGYVYVDGERIGSSPPTVEVPLAPGKHRIEARNDQANPPVVSREIDVAGGAQQDVRLRFGE